MKFLTANWKVLLLVALVAAAYLASPVDDGSASTAHTMQLVMSQLAHDASGAHR